MAGLGDVGKMNSENGNLNFSFSVFGSQPLGNVSNGTGATADAIIVLVSDFLARIDYAVANGSGDFSFYDLANRTYYAYEIGESNKSWKIEVVANVPTVTQLTSSSPVVRTFTYIS